MTSTRSSRRRALGQLAGLSALPFTASWTGQAMAQSSSPSAADWDKVIEAAKKEKKLVFYHATLGSTLQPRIIKSFEDRYGIEVQDLNARASEIRERIRTEQSSGRFLGDVAMNGHTTMALQDIDGNFDPAGTIPNRAKLIATFPTTSTLLPVHVQTYGILVNSKLIKSAEAPRSWKDLLDPKYKGKILSDDVRALGGGSVFFFVMQDKFGRGYHEALAANMPVFSREIVNDEMRIARGEYAIYIPELTNYAVLMKDQPVQYIVPTEGVPFVQFDVAMLKNAPHPNAARLFLNHFLDMDSQLILSNAGLVPVVTGATAKTDAAARAVVDVKLLGTSDVNRQNEMLDLAKTIYKS